MDGNRPGSVAAPSFRVGLAGWANPPVQKTHRRDDHSHLQHYADRFTCVEINTSFYRPHRSSTYAAWNGATPDGFRFAVKMPRAITHESALADVDEEIDTFFSDIEALRPKLAVILIQLPPSIEFDARVVRAFFKRIPRQKDTRVVCEPRHASWFKRAADSLLDKLSVSRVAADPPKCASAELPGGDKSFQYFRWHGSPHMYYSSYTQQQLEHFADQIDHGIPTWCIFDNTARYAAWDNALSFASMKIHTPAAIRGTAVEERPKDG